MVNHTKLLGVMGWPVAHSLSPRLHQYWIEQHKLNAVYLPLPVKPEDFADALRALPKLGFSGVNVTIPHKEAACSLVDELTPEARRIGAVNTIIAAPDGRLTGANTDLFGFAENLRAAGYDIGGGAALVLGAGGAARAVLAALRAGGCRRIILTNRTPARAQALADSMGGAIEIIDWERRHECLAETSLVVNTTSLGMEGQEALMLDLTAMPPGGAVCDLVYKPLLTPLLRQAAARQLSAIDGLGMLLYQAQAAFRHWLGIMPEVTPMLRRHILAEPSSIR